MSDETPRQEARRLVEAATIFWPSDRSAAIRMARQGVNQSDRPPRRSKALLRELDRIAAGVSEEQQAARLAARDQFEAELREMTTFALAVFDATGELLDPHPFVERTSVAIASDEVRLGLWIAFRGMKHTGQLIWARDVIRSEGEGVARAAIELAVEELRKLESDD